MIRLHSNDTEKDEDKRTKKEKTIIGQDKRDDQDVRHTNQKSAAEGGLI